MDAAEKVAMHIFWDRWGSGWEVASAGDRARCLGEARRWIAAFPQIALEGREETGTAPVLGYPDDMCDVTRTVWSTEWSEVQS